MTRKLIYPTALIIGVLLAAIPIAIANYLSFATIVDPGETVWEDVGRMAFTLYILALDCQ